MPRVGSLRRIARVAPRLWPGVPITAFTGALGVTAGYGLFFLWERNHCEHSGVLTFALALIVAAATTMSVDWLRERLPGHEDTNRLSSMFLLALCFELFVLSAHSIVESVSSAISPSAISPHHLEECRMPLDATLAMLALGWIVIGSLVAALLSSLIYYYWVRGRGVRIWHLALTACVGSITIAWLVIILIASIQRLILLVRMLSDPDEMSKFIDHDSALNPALHPVRFFALLAIACIGSLLVARLNRDRHWVLLTAAAAACLSLIPGYQIIAWSVSFSMLAPALLCAAILIPLALAIWGRSRPLLIFLVIILALKVYHVFAEVYSHEYWSVGTLDDAKFIAWTLWGLNGLVLGLCLPLLEPFGRSRSYVWGIVGLVLGSVLVALAIVRSGLPFNTDGYAPDDQLMMMVGILAAIVGALFLFFGLSVESYWIFAAFILAIMSIVPAAALQQITFFRVHQELTLADIRARPMDRALAAACFRTYGVPNRTTNPWMTRDAAIKGLITQIGELQTQIQSIKGEPDDSNFVTSFHSYCADAFGQLRELLQREVSELQKPEDGRTARFELSMAGAFGFWITIGLLITWTPLARRKSIGQSMHA